MPSCIKCIKAIELENADKMPLGASVKFYSGEPYSLDKVFIDLGEPYTDQLGTLKYLCKKKEAFLS